MFKILDSVWLSFEKVHMKTIPLNVIELKGSKVACFILLRIQEGQESWKNRNAIGVQVQGMMLDW
ncbi:hypothetical protein [Cyclobacterium roseum]|uniref:hypothetical protein n=1 Tax=Cyclobacterium roseum TaxID=2666137 RepID=UPI00139180B4|nr:hypothetical protein [Cyclobacterium roseum]